jgi:hypothetical protein
VAPLRFPEMISERRFRLKSLIKGAKILKDVEGAIGRPDQIFDNFDPESGIVTRYSYENLSESAVLSVRRVTTRFKKWKA